MSAPTDASVNSASAKQTHKWVVLGSCSLSLLMTSMDLTITNVALPSIRTSLGGTVSGLQWIADAYSIMLAGFLISSGAMADRLGRRRVFQAGLALFCLSSLACSLAPSVGVLVAARALQGLSGSMMNPVAMSIITNTFTDARERARAVGVWSAVVGVSMAVGPVVGGFLTEYVGWRSVFWVNVPIGVTAIVLTALFVPESKAARPRRIDPVGQVLLVVVLLGLTYSLIEAPARGWTSPPIVGLLLVVVVALVAVLGYERAVEQPLIDPRFFRSIPFTTANVNAMLTSASLGAFMFINVLYLQGSLGLSPLQAGVRMIPLALAVLVFSVMSGRMVARFGTRPSLLLAGSMIALSAVTLTGLSLHTPYVVLAVSYALFGIGFGTGNAPITATALSGMPISQAGVAAGINSTSRQVGASVGVALAGTLTGIGTASHIGASLVHQARPLWWVIVGAGLAMAASGIVSASRAARASAARVREVFGEH